LHIEVDTSITSARLVRIFEQVKRDHGLPQVIRSDNSPEFLGERFVQWLKANGVALRYIRPGKPTQNAYIERFNRPSAKKCSTNTSLPASRTYAKQRTDG
jgi:putative transposase